MHAAGLCTILTACGPSCRHERVTLVCTGALTNAALLVTLFPEVLHSIEIVLMGGCMGTGNTGSVAEFNIQVQCLPLPRPLWSPGILGTSASQANAV